MNTHLDPSKQESSSISSLSSVGVAASSSTAPLFLRRSRQDSSFRAKAEAASLSVTAASAFCDSLEEEESSSSQSFECDRVNSGTVKRRQSQEFHSDFSDSLEDSADDTHDTTFESDTCSFYSVRSQRTPRGNSSEASLLGSGYFSEGTLYDSAQSLLTATPSCQSSFWSVRSFTALDENHQVPLPYQADRDSDHHQSASGFYVDCTSCPDLSPTGIRKDTKGPYRPSWLDSFHVSQALSHCDINSSGLDDCDPSALIIRSQSDSTMSAVEGSPSPKVGDEFETKKKKGLMSSFRKSRKTSRKLRQQKKAANDGDSTSTGTGVMSDGEQDLLIDSEPSAPNSPAPVKNDLLKDGTTDVEIPADKNSETSLDCHQATHERLNGTSSSPKESSEPSSKNSSPLMVKSNKIAETAKKFEDKDDKKAGRNKFGSSLFRKKKAEQQSTQQPSKDASDTTVSETTAPKEQPKTEPEQPSTDDSLPEGTAEIAVPEQPGPADVKSSSFRSYISSVQLVKNWTVNSEAPKSQLSPETLAKTSRDAVDGGRAAVEGKSAAPEETSTTTIETKKVMTASANGKPSATEVTSKKTTTVTIVSKPSPKLRGSSAYAAGRGKGPASPPSPSAFTKMNSKTSPISTSPKSNPRQSKAPSPKIPKKPPSEVMASPAPDDTEFSRKMVGINSPRHQPLPPVTVTPPEPYPRETQASYPTKSPLNESPQVGKAVTYESQQQQPPKIVINESLQPKNKVLKESQQLRETKTNEQQPKTVLNSFQPLQKVAVSNPLQSKFTTMSKSQEPEKVPVSEPRQTRRAHDGEPQVKAEPPAAEPQPPKRVPIRLNPGDAAVTPNPVPVPVSPSPGMVTPPSSPEGNSERDARETPEGDRTENEKNSLLDSTGLTDSWAGASTDKREHLYKILVIGELGTGKTSIIKRYVHQFFSQHYRATIGVDFALKVLNWDNNTVIRLQLWDIAGQERFGNMTRVYYKEAVGAFVVFDVTRAQTFDAVTKWKTDLDTKVTLADGSPIPAVLLANKCDQPKEGVVNNPARMDDYCRERGFSGWFETSAKENINIDEASRFLVNKILSNEKQGMMMTESLDTDKFSVDGKANPVDRSGCRC